MAEREDARGGGRGARRAERRKGKKKEKEKWERWRERQGLLMSIRYTWHCVTQNVFQILMMLKLRNTDLEGSC